MVRSEEGKARKGDWNIDEYPSIAKKVKGSEERKARKYG